MKSALSVLCLMLFVLVNVNVGAMTPVSVTVQANQPGLSIPEDALGLSYEAFTLLPDQQGRHYFRPDNQPLVTVFKTLGVRSLRIGGNSVDAPSIPLPQEEDVRQFFEFAQAVDVKVIYSLRLEDGDPNYAARIARLIHDCHAGTLQYFAIGNEPDYYKDYDVYTTKWTAIRDAIVKEFPEALFCGPDQNPSPDLCQKMIRDFGNESGRLAMITQHNYPMGCSYKNPSAAWKSQDLSVLIPADAKLAREKMLSPKVWDVYAGIHSKIFRGVADHDFPCRMTEVNSYWFSGLKGASNTYASALWGIDYLYWWMQHGVCGMNFHTGDASGGEGVLPCQYAAFVTSENGYHVRPLGYAMKMFAWGGRGRHLPLELSPQEQGVVAYATLADEKRVFVTLVNRTHGQEGEGKQVQIKLNEVAQVTQAEVIFLTAPGGDIAAESNLSLGGAAIEQDGHWDGHWTPVEPMGQGNAVISITMPPASAAVVQMLLQ